MRVQEHALEPELSQVSVELRIPVLRIPRHGMAGVCGVHPNLMGASGMQRHLDEGRRAAEELHGTKLAHRRLALRMSAHGALPVFAQVRSQRNIDALAAESAEQPGTTRAAQRVGTLVADAQDALHASPADVPSARRALRELVPILKGGVAGIEPGAASRMLDLALGTLGHL